MLARQVLEIEALRATFPEDGAVVLSESEQLALEQAQALIELSEEAADNLERPLLSGSVYNLECKLQGRPIGLRFQFPRRYPEAEERADLQVVCDTGEPIKSSAVYLPMAMEGI